MSMDRVIFCGGITDMCQAISVLSETQCLFKFWDLIYNNRHFAALVSLYLCYSTLSMEIIWHMSYILPTKYRKFIDGQKYKTFIGDIFAQQLGMTLQCKLLTWYILLCLPCTSYIYKTVPKLIPYRAYKKCIIATVYN